MKEKITDERPTAPIEVEVTIKVSQATALWLIEISELHGDSVHNIASRIVDDVAHEDRLAHEEAEIIVH